MRVNKRILACRVDNLIIGQQFRRRRGIGGDLPRIKRGLKAEKCAAIPAGCHGRHSREPAGSFVLKINICLNLCAIREGFSQEGKWKHQKKKKKQKKCWCIGCRRPLISSNVCRRFNKTTHTFSQRAPAQCLSVRSKTNEIFLDLRASRTAFAEFVNTILNNVPQESSAYRKKCLNRLDYQFSIKGFQEVTVWNYVSFSALNTERQAAFWMPFLLFILVSTDAFIFIFYVGKQACKVLEHVFLLRNLLCETWKLI